MMLPKFLELWLVYSWPDARCATAEAVGRTSAYSQNGADED